MRARQAALTGIITSEIGKTPAEGTAEEQESIDMAYYMAGEGRRCFGQTVPSELPEKWTMSIRELIGLVADHGVDFSGCGAQLENLPGPGARQQGHVETVGKKHAERCAAAWAEVFADAGLPAGVLQMVTGDARLASGWCGIRRRGWCV